MFTKKSSPYDEFLDFLIRAATPEQILNYHPSKDSEQRALELLERNSAGTLTEAEALELEQMAETDRMVSLLKARASSALPHA